MTMKFARGNIFGVHETMRRQVADKSMPMQRRINGAVAMHRDCTARDVTVRVAIATHAIGAECA